MDVYSILGTAAATRIHINYLSFSIPVFNVYAYTHSFLVSSVDVGLVDLNHFSRDATPRCSVKNSSRFTLFSFSSSSLYTCYVKLKRREREREGMNSSFEAHTDAHFRIYYSSSRNDECAYIGRSLRLMFVALLVVIVVSALSHSDLTSQKANENKW